jgi:endonuclease YncB( thermonuclease family)
LAKCRFVVIRTYKSDKYDRYLADVFYNAGKMEPQAVADMGAYLNGELVARGLAKMWK